MTSPPSSIALVTAARWRSQSGIVHSTIVGKLTMQLSDGGRAALVRPDPLIAFDRIAPDGRYVTEASELMPWTTVASVILYGGPLRFSLEFEGGARALVVSSAANTLAGHSMTSQERAGYAPRTPSRGPDGVLTMPEGIDGRYFVAAPKTQQLDAIKGDERFLLELSGWHCRRRLASMVMVASVDVEGTRREVALTNDMITVNGAERRISLVGRALVRGDATLVSHAVVPIGHNRVSDRGDTPMIKKVPGLSASRPGLSKHEIVNEETAMLGAKDFSFDETFPMESDRGHDATAPFSLEAGASESESSQRSIALPATPFDPGFVSAPVLPGVGVVETLAPDEELQRQLMAVRAQLRGEKPKPAIQPPLVVPSAPPSHPALAHPALANPALANPALANPAAQPEDDDVAPPKPGAMAKPRFLKRR